MKTIYVVLAAITLVLFSSFKNTKACAYAESNMGYIISQTRKALEQNDINRIRLFTYRAINAYEKSKVQFKDCGCNYATTIIYENNENLKMAVRTHSLTKAKVFLFKSLENTLKSIDLLEKHDAHNSYYMQKKEASVFKLASEKKIYGTVDQSLLKYEKSLNKVVNTIECKEALAFARKIYLHCEQELLKSSLTEGKKYYNLRTKEITAKALEAIGYCNR